MLMFNSYRRIPGFLVHVALWFVFLPAGLGYAQPSQPEAGRPAQQESEADIPDNPSVAADSQAPTAEESLQELKEAVGECAPYDSAIVRLQCYDVVADSLGFEVATGLKVEEQRLSTYGFWEASAQKNNVGEEFTYLKLKSNSPVFLPGGVRNFPELVIRCKIKTTDVYLDWGRRLVDERDWSEKTVITYRFDADPKRSEGWELSLDKQAAFVPKPVEFVREMKKKKVLTIEITPFNGYTSTLVYTLAGVENAISNVILKRCYS